MDDKLITSVMNLCDKLSNAIDANMGKIESLEQRVKQLEQRQRAEYSQKEAAQLTGWSVAAIGNWIGNGFLTVIPGSGRNPRVPACEIDKILSRKGYGPKLRKKAS